MVENRICNVWECLSLRRRLKKKGYILVGSGQICLNIISKHSKKAGKIGIKRCLQLPELHFYIRFQAIYKPNLVGGEKVSPPIFLVKF